MITAGLKLTGVERCPQCGIANPTLEFKAVVSDSRDLERQQRTWLCYICTSCFDLIAVRGMVLFDPIGTADPRMALLSGPMRPDIVLPKPLAVSSELPERAKRYLEQASGSLYAPDGAVMLAGSAVDAMLKEKGLVNGSVHKRIEDAVTTGILTRDMAEWAHHVRLGANAPRHADLEDPHATREQAIQAIQFASALGDFLFVFPARVAKGKEAAEAAETSKAPE